MNTLTNCAEKKAKQILNLLQGYTKGIRLTAILILLLMGVSNAWAVNITSGTKLYLKPSANWNQDGARFAAYFFGNGDAWVSMTKRAACDGDIYEVISPNKSYPNVIFCRMNPSTTANNWNNKWNQTNDLTYDGTNNLYTVKEGTWDKGGGTWSIAEIKTTMTYTVTVPEGTEKCYIIGEWDGWNEFKEMASGAGNTFSISFESCSGYGYKYACAPSWGFQELNSNCNGTINDRTYSANDVVECWSKKTIYVKVDHSDWKRNDERFAIYWWDNDSHNGWVDLEEIACNNYYKADIPLYETSFSIVRMNGATSANNWDNKWNQTIDLNWTAAGDNNLYTVNDKESEKYKGFWSSSLLKITTNTTTGGNITVSPGETVNIGETITVTLNAQPDFVKGNATIKIGNNSAETLVEGQAYTICGATTIDAEFIPSTPTPVYLKTTNWNADNAWFAIYWWKSAGNDGWVKMNPVDCNGDYYYGEVPAGTTHFIFVRLKPSTENEYNSSNNGLHWDNKWNQTGNLGLPNADANLFTPNATDGATATWSTYVAPTYSITINAGTGGNVSVSESSNIALNEQVTVTVNTSEGYTYKSGTIAIGTNETTNIIEGQSKHTICGPTTITAQWIANKYEVTLNNQGATTAGTALVQATYGSAMPEATMPTRTGYTFGGYYTETNGGGTQYYKADGTSAKNWDIASKTTLYAKWTANTYTITWNPNGGTVNPTSSTYTYDGAEIQMPTPTRNGYSFAGWWTAANGGTQITAIGTTTKPTSNVTYYAHWTENKASIVIKSSDDNKGTVSPQEASVGVATTVTVTATPADGYYTQSWTATAPAVSSATTGNTTTLSGNGTIGNGLLVATFSERYQLISQHATNTIPGNNPYFTKQGDGSWACIVTLAANTEYSFKVKDYANNSEEYGNSVSALQSCADWVKIWKEANSAIKFKSTQAGSYTIHIRWSGAEGISLTAPQVKITYPALPTTPAVAFTAVRVYEEQTINSWVAGNGAQATPYQFYNDEAVQLTVTPLTEVAGLTAYYKVGETEQTANTFDLTNITTEVTPITITTYYKDSYGNKGTEATTTVYFQQVLTPQLLLITDPVKEISLEKVKAGTKVELTYSATYNGYTGSVTIKENETILATTSETKKVFYSAPTDIGILTFTATTEEVAGRVFEVRTEVAVYKLVTIKVNDPNSILSNVYMWRGDDAGAADVKTEWPGESFAQHFGTWRVFVVKYPYYDHFIVNGGSNENQTFNYEIPSENKCYQLSNNKVTQNGFTNYTLTPADCPGDLAVSNIDDITLTEGEQEIVVPSVQVSLGNKLSDVTATVSSADKTKATAIMSGTNIIVYGHAEGTTTITVEYTLHGATVTKKFQVTVERDTYITIQVKVPISFGDDAQYQWTNNDKIYIHYWGTGLSDRNIPMSYLSADNTYKYLQAEIPLGTDNKTCFLVYYDYMDSEHARWRQTDDVKDEYAANRDGCYLLHSTGVQDTHNRGIERTGDYCWEEADKYQVKIVMQNGKEYSSNTVTNTSDILSFFAPGKDEVNYRSGVVMLYKNDNLHTTIHPATFSESNVYTAQINDDGTGLTNVAVYSGNYYVRTYGDGDWGQGTYQQWTDDQRKERKFTSFVSREDEFYNHYWVDDLAPYIVDGNASHKDISGYVANIYNNDLAGKLVDDATGTTKDGKILFGEGRANVRFGYDPRTNYFGRAVLKGSGETNDFLNVHCDNAFSDAACQTVLPNGTSVKANKFTDMSNWVYQSEFYVKIEGVNSKAKLYIDATAYPIDNNTSKNHLLGYEINENDGSETDIPRRRTIINAGTDDGIYHMVVIYDFKTNRLITAWKPEATNNVTEEKTIISDVIFIRHENDDAPQINLSGQGRINELQTLYFALEFDRGSANADERYEEQYWFTLPFDCAVGEISGVPGYMETWGIQRYRGDLRAQQGWFIETSTFWQWLTLKDTLRAGEGYVLAFDKRAASWAEYEDHDADGEIRSILRLYFPSLKDTFNLQQATQKELTDSFPDHTCTITYKDRYKQDSNWKVIGTTSYNNATISSIVKDTVPNYNTWKDKDVPNFRYKYTYQFDSNNKREWYRYEPEDGKTATYKSFFSYMVQFAGTITWNPINKSVNPEGLAARRYVPEGERTSFTTRLEIANAEGEKQDQAFVTLDENGTTGFDQNKDLNKIINAGTNIYTLAENISYAGNTLAMEKQTVPVGVVIAESGEYTFRMPDGTDGISVTLVDNATGTHTNMLMDEYTVTLNAGTIENRFYLVVDPDRTATSVENIGEEADKAKGVEKFLIDGKLFIRTADGIFDAKGQRL